MMFWSCLLPPFPILILLGSINSIVSSSSSYKSDELALQAFKSQIQDDPYGALSNWNNSIDYCDWSGVTCSHRHHKRVTHLDLKSQKLRGMLSPHIGNLSFLKVIVLTMNNFYGPIPQEVGRLFRLQVLHLNNNTFDGEIPSNLTHCSNLLDIDLIDNKISGRIPVGLTSLSNLLYLGLSKNELQGSLPPSLGNLSSVSIISLAYNNLKENIPEDLCRIHTIDTLQLSKNMLTGMVPSCLYNLTNMTLLSLGANQLDGNLPVHLGLNLPNLQMLYLGGNNFKGPIPLSLLNVSQLQVIDVSQNQLTGQVPINLGRLHLLRSINLEYNELGSSSGDDLSFINSFANISSLELLSVYNNTLKGSIPKSIANFSTNLTGLHLGSNQIYGRIPYGIQNLLGLHELTINANNINGKIPEGMGKLHKMEGLKLHGNQFSGEIPDSFGNLTQLLILTLTENKLHGNIPLSLGNCTKLMFMSLSYNTLTGTIPRQIIGISSSMIMLFLSHNALSGHLPSEVGKLNNLESFDISNNRLSGQIPDTLGKCLMLEKLFMGNNLFQGKIPQALSKLSSIQTLDLSRNKLSGGIPKYLMNFTLLTILGLSYNELEGPVPKDGIFANASLFSVDNNKNLCGGVVELKLPPCPIKTISKDRHLVQRYVIPTIVVSFILVLVLCFLLVFYRGRISTQTPFSPSLYNHHFPRISYAELHKATNSFSPDNLVGSGSYGTVYKGILDQFTSAVAVKVLHLERGGASKSFLSECDSLRNIRHRNLVKIVTCCSSVDFHGNDFKALVFELMSNGSLEEWLHLRRDEDHGLRNMNFLQRLNIAIDVASALDYLHHHCQPTIVHCDIKTSNVLLNDDMTAHVADFGLAKIFSATSYDSSQSQGSSLAVKGSVGYIPPEYGMGCPVSVEGDVYSYGILLLEMLTRKRPTDDMFQNGNNLHNFAKTALPENVTVIVDPRILLQVHDNDAHSPNHSKEGFKLQKDKQFRMLECLVSLTRVGVMCSVESPTERMNMEDVLIELCRIKDHHQGLVNCQH